MPTYQYACTACGHELEAVQSFSDDALTECPTCQGRLRKRFGSVGVVFKGPGFYRTDSRSGSNGSSTDGSKNGASGEAGKKDAAKTDGGKSDAGKSDAGKSGSSASSGGDKSSSGASKEKAAA